MVIRVVNETVAAVSTAYGRGGIAVIRISGEKAISVAEKMFSTLGGKLLRQTPDRTAVYGDIVGENGVIDDGIAVIYRAPRSYTGEDTVEISCHGGILLTEKVLSRVFECGASPAAPGEFTQRAFVNGKLDLSKAEAVIGLIDAESEQQLKLNGSHARGIMKRCIDGYCREITSLISSVYVCIDYPDEDLEDVSRDEMLVALRTLSERMCSTLSTYREGKAVNEGIDTVILGKPNAGKSSLLNRLLGEERAIVTDIAGTTRDTVEEKMTLGRIILNLCDTAGIRETEDKIEQIGVRRALEKAERAELILGVFDGSRRLDREDEELIEALSSLVCRGKSVIAVINKSDTTSALIGEEVGRRLFGDADKSSEDGRIISVSALTGEGTEALKQAVESLFIKGEIDYNTVAVLANARQHNSMKMALDAVNRAITALENGFGTDVCGMDLEQALAYLGEIDGRSVTEAITEDIFHRFCVGK
ncbi:MAG: tRNA uridine-5-carboxymethylaminomethyl(34) synthesis GTPase MnmE [Clostridia bacterium]|nr:tRNA uridine-5-carboxymethylaminomethyl(34) synthesis GTPase MnmE [Clostridia bacterium]